MSALPQISTTETKAGSSDFPSMQDRLDDWQRRIARTDWTPWLLVGGAALLRFFLLGIKPPHFDEGINGWFVDQMVKTGFYRYDPTNYHGPLHFYVLFLSQTLLGRNLWALRLPVVVVSTVCVWLTLKFEPFVGRNVSRLAAIAMAVSPGFVFYGRYSIHEVWLVLFSMLFILGLLGLWKSGTTGYLWCTGMGLTGMILTKETYVIHIACAAAAAGVCYVSNQMSRVPDARPAKQRWDYVDLAVVSATGIFLIIFFYSGTFFHWNGVKDLFRAYAAWFATGQEGHGHEKPWYYWLGLIARYELPVLVGVILCLFCQRFKSISLRYLAIYGVGTLMAYSIVHYKTPWCIVSIVWPLLFIFAAGMLLAPLRYPPQIYRNTAIVLGTVLAFVIGYALKKHFYDIWPYFFLGGAAIVLIALRNRTWIYALSLLALGASFVSAIWLNYFRCSTDTEPYVYVQTYNDIFKLTRPVLALAKRSPAYYQLVGHIIRTSSYPLPWVFGDFPNIGYYEHESLPTPVDADFLLVQPDRIEEIEKKLQNAYFAEPLTIRPYQEQSKVYFDAKRFKDFFPGRMPNIPAKGPG